MGEGAVNRPRPKIRDGVSALGSTRRGLFWTLTLEMAIAHRRAYIEWCEQSMKLLEEALLDGKSAVERQLSTGDQAAS